MKTSAEYTRAYRERQRSLLGADELKRRENERLRAKRRARGLKKPGPKVAKNRLTKEMAVEKFRAVHGDRYQYPGEYVGAHAPMEMVCATHGIFMQRPSNHNKGANCPSCGAESRGRKTRLGIEEFLTRARKAHGDTYDYSSTNMVNQTDEVEISCPVHGPFTQLATTHTAGSGCPSCANIAKADAKRMTIEGFLARATAVHGDRYEYKIESYTSRLSPIIAVCKKHGEFSQVAANHLNGNGCQLCGNTLSRGEIEVADYCRSIYPGVITHDRKVLSPNELDIYIPEKKLAIEYCGVYWHSDLVKYGHDVKARHRLKWQACLDLGIRLITIYEDDWADRRAAVEAVIRSALGATPAIHGRACVVGVVANKEAIGFHNLHHVQGAPHIGIHYGLFHNDELVAVMTFSASASGRGYEGWELTRFSSSQRVAGGASKLFTAFVRQHNPSMIRSYSDNRYFTGAMYPQLGFALESERPPSYRVVNPKIAKTYHQRLFQRKFIPQRLKEVGSKDIFDPLTDKRTEHEVCIQNGFGRIYDCGKKRWLWQSPSK